MFRPDGVVNTQRTRTGPEITAYYAFKPSIGELAYFNEEAKGMNKIEMLEKNVKKFIPFDLGEFQIVDIKRKACGYNPTEGAGISSREVGDMFEEVFDIYVGNQKRLSGTFMEIKDALKELNGSMAYILYVLNSEKELVKVELEKSAATEFLKTFTAKDARLKGQHAANILKLGEAGKDIAGGNIYYTPNFEVVRAATAEDNKVAMDFYNDLNKDPMVVGATDTTGETFQEEEISIEDVPF